jgi:NTP pyrophosphatase (non-canonical NTP hydrolase)
VTEQQPTLKELQRHYLEARGHTLSIAGMGHDDALRAQARYVRGEALELCDAAEDMLALDRDDDFGMDAAGDHLIHEIADVVLAVVTLANLFGWSVEDCIDAKTEFDRGRG